MQGFLIAHGEKLAVALVAVICGIAVYATLGDETTQATTNLPEIAEVVDKLDQAYQNPGQPNLAPTRDFEDEIQARFLLQVDAEPVIAWLHRHPDLEVVVGDATRQLYVYEIGTPEVVVEDLVGKLRVSVELPGGERPNRDDDYIKDAPRGAAWVRREPSGQVENRARREAVLLEYRVHTTDMEAEDGWQPLDTDGSPGGVLTGGGSVVLEGVDPWQLYQVRARSLVRATGITGRDDPAWAVGNEVLPIAGRLPFEDGQVPAVWNAAAERIMVPFAEERAFVDLVARPFTGDAPSQRREWGRLFVGRASPVEEVLTKAKVYLGLERVSPGFAGEEPKAKIIVKRLMDDQGDGKRNWTEPEQFSVPVGEKVGRKGVMKEVRIGPDRVMEIPIDLSTPFTVQSIEQDVERVVYHEVRLKGVQQDDGTWSKELQIEPEIDKVDVVNLVNAANGQQVKLVEFARIRPPRGRNRWSYPAIPEGGIDEEQLFLKQPLEYDNPEMVPERPIEHFDLELLNQLEDPRVAQLASLPYVEMPDGRVLYYLPNIKEVEMRIIPGSDWDKYGPPESGVVEERPEDPVEDPVDEPGRDEPPPDDLPPEEMPPDGIPPDGMGPEFDPEDPAFGGDPDMDGRDDRRRRRRNR